MFPEPSFSVRLEKDSTYIPEVWTWYIIGIVVIVLRWFVRVQTVGFKGLKSDDYLTVLFTFLWTINAVILQITYCTGENIDVRPNEAPTLSDYDVWVLTYGSVWEFVSWYTYSGTIWTLKLQVLFFYKRLSLDLLRPRTANAVFSFTCLAYVALVLTISLSCRPYHHNWQINPLPGPECTFRAQNFWTVVVLNVATDLAIMSIPTPLLFRLRVPWARKLGVSALLLSGLFMVSTAVVRAVQTLTGARSVVKVNLWGFRETGVGMLAVNAAVLMPLLTRRFWRHRRGSQRAAAEEGAEAAAAAAAAKAKRGWVGRVCTLSSVVCASTTLTTGGGGTADRGGGGHAVGTFTDLEQGGGGLQLQEQGALRHEQVTEPRAGGDVSPAEAC